MSRAAAASSAVPVVLSPVTVNNYGGTCHRSPPEWVKLFVDSHNPPRPAARAIRSLKGEEAFGDSVHRPHLHVQSAADDVRPASRSGRSPARCRGDDHRRLARIQAPAEDVGAKIVANPTGSGSAAEVAATPLPGR
jgi:hypothetical protein